MNYKDIVALYFERSNQMQTFWTFWLCVCVGMPLLVTLVRGFQQRLVIASVLSFSFAVTAAVSLSAAVATSEARLACRDMIDAHTLQNAPPPQEMALIEGMILPPSVFAVASVQICGDCLALATAWYLALSRRSSH